MMEIERLKLIKDDEEREQGGLLPGNNSKKSLLIKFTRNISKG